MWVFKDRWQHKDGSWWQSNPNGGEPIPVLQNNNGFHVNVPDEHLISSLSKRHPKIGDKVRAVEESKAQARDVIEGLNGKTAINEQDLLRVMVPCETLLQNAVSVLEEVYWRLKRDKNKEADKLGVAIHDGKNIMMKLNLCIWCYQNGKTFANAYKVWSDVLPFIQDNSGFWQVYDLICGKQKQPVVEELSHAI